MGTYIPSGFSIYLNTLPHNLNTRDATFVHEYTHFLQDIILPYCIRENLVFVNNFAWISKMAETNQNLIMDHKDKFCDYDACSQYLLGIGWKSKGGFDESILTKTERRLNDLRERLS